MDKENITEESIDLIEIFRVIWRGKYIVILISTVCAVFSVYYSLSLNNMYTSSAMLKLSNGNEQNQVSALGSQFAGIASMTGISMPGIGDDKSHFVIQTLKSREFTKHILTIKDIRPEIIAANEYSLERNELIFDIDVFDYDLEQWTRKPKKNRKPIPSYLEVHNKLMQSFDARLDKDSGFVSISYTHISPVFAKDFLDLVIKELNNLSRAKDQLESSNALEYLENEVLNIQQKDIRDSINELISMQLKTKMLSNVNQEYLLSRIDSPFVPEMRSSPNRALICIALTLMGAFFGMMIVILREFFSTKIE